MINDEPIQNSQPPIPVSQPSIDSLTPPESVAFGARHHLLWLLASLGVIGLSYFLAVETSSGMASSEITLSSGGSSLPSICYWKNMTGRDCPGCGMTRSFVSLADGSFLAAWNFNPGGFLLFGVLVFQVPYRSLQLLRFARKQPAIKLPAQTAHVLAYVVVAVLFSQWIWKWLR